VSMACRPGVWRGAPRRAVHGHQPQRKKADITGRNCV